MTPHRDQRPRRPPGSAVRRRSAERSSASIAELLVGGQRRWGGGRLRPGSRGSRPAARVRGRCRAARCRGTAAAARYGLALGSMSFSSALAPCGLPGVAAMNRTAASRFSRPQHARGTRPVAGLEPQPPTAPNPRRRRSGPAVPASTPAIADPPSGRMPCGPSPPENSGPSASARDRCRCAPLPAAPSNGTGENEIRRPCRAAARPSTMRVEDDGVRGGDRGGRRQGHLELVVAVFGVDLLDRAARRARRWWRGRPGTPTGPARCGSRRATTARSMRGPPSADEHRALEFGADQGGQPRCAQRPFGTRQQRAGAQVPRHRPAGR